MIQQIRINKNIHREGYSPRNISVRQNNGCKVKVKYDEHKNV